MGGLMHRVWRILPGLLVAGLVLAPGWGRTEQDHSLYQVSSVAALLAGVYDGSVRVGELKRHGDFGLGTFEGLDGEMIMLDGVCYQALVSGDVREAPDSAMTPFAAVAFFRPRASVEIRPVASLQDLGAVVKNLLPDVNRFYAFRLSGTLDMVKVRSVPKQKRPYPPLAEAVEEQQVFTAEGVAGDLVGIYCPPAAAGLNVVGSHVHFIDAARKRGGHVLDLRADALTLDVAPLDGLRAALPRSDEYEGAELCGDREEGLQRIER